MRDRGAVAAIVLLLLATSAASMNLTKPAQAMELRRLSSVLGRPIGWDRRCNA
jgi:hypothetical protein